MSIGHRLIETYTIEQPTPLMELITAAVPATYTTDDPPVLLTPAIPAVYAPVHDAKGHRVAGTPVVKTVRGLFDPKQTYILKAEEGFAELIDGTLYMLEDPTLTNEAIITAADGSRFKIVAILRPQHQHIAAKVRHLSKGPL
jgi:hypothetical protein